MSFDFWMVSRGHAPEQAVHYSATYEEAVAYARTHADTTSPGIKSSDWLVMHVVERVRIKVGP